MMLEVLAAAAAMGLCWHQWGYVGTNGGAGNGSSMEVLACWWQWQRY